MQVQTAEAKQLNIEDEAQCDILLDVSLETTLVLRLKEINTFE